MKRFIAVTMIVTSLVAMAESNRKYEIRLTDFTNLEVDNNIRVDYKVNADSAGIAVFYATDRMASQLYFADNHKGKVEIQNCAECTGIMEYPHVTIYSTTLRRIMNSGDSLVTVTGLQPIERFEAIVCGNGMLVVDNVEAAKVDVKLATGNGQITINGSCKQANINCTGTGTIQADRLHATEGKVTIMGTGTVGCDVVETLTIQGMGSGKVYYRTEPGKIKSRSIGIKYMPLP